MNNVIKNIIIHTRVQLAFPVELIALFRWLHDRQKEEGFEVELSMQISWTTWSICTVLGEQEDSEKI